MIKPSFPGFTAGLLASGVALFVYGMTAASSVVAGDSGELAAAAATLGIAHPSGYPLFTLLGRAASALPLGIRVISELNLMAALFCAAALCMFHGLLLSWLVVNDSASGAARIIAWAATLSLGFSRTFWTQAVSVEVYSLQLLLFFLILLLFRRALEGAAFSRAPEDFRAWLVFAFALGLGFGNHLTTVLLLPALLYLYFSVRPSGKAAWRHAGWAALAFLAGLSLYLYLPLRAMSVPRASWGDLAGAGGFWRHVIGSQYHFQLFASFEAIPARLLSFLIALPVEFGYAPLLFAALGAVRLRRASPSMWRFSLLILTTCVAYSVSYAIADIEAYFLPAHIVVAIWAAFGALASLEKVVGSRRPWIVAGVVAALILPPLALNYRAVDRHRDFAAEDYARNMLASLDGGALLLTTEFQYFGSAARYLQEVEGVRPDVVVVDLNLLTYPWYLEHLAARFPAVFRDSRREADSFLLEASKVASLHKPVARDFAGFVARHVDLARSLVADNHPARPVYATFEIGMKYTQGFQRVPAGLAFRLFPEGPPPAISSRAFSFRPLREHSPDAVRIRSDYATAYLNQGLYQALLRGDTAAGVRMLRASLAVRPDFPEAAGWLSRLLPSP